MKKIVLDIQSAIHAHNMERMLMQELEDCQVIVSEFPIQLPNGASCIMPMCF